MIGRSASCQLFPSTRALFPPACSAHPPSPALPWWAVGSRNPSGQRSSCEVQKQETTCTWHPPNQHHWLCSFHPVAAKTWTPDGAPPGSLRDRPLVLARPRLALLWIRYSDSPQGLRGFWGLGQGDRGIAWLATLEKGVVLSPLAHSLSCFPSFPLRRKRERKGGMEGRKGKEPQATKLHIFKFLWKQEIDSLFRLMWGNWGSSKGE